MHRVDGALRAIGARYLHSAFRFQVLFLTLVVLLKNGVGLAPSGGGGLVQAVSQFPRPSGYESASIGPTFIGHLLRIDTQSKWLTFSAVLTVLALVLGLFVASRLEPYRRSVVVLVLMSSSATASLTQHVGNYDWMTFLGAVILALSSNRIIIAVGALMMALGNPEQALIATILLLILSLSDDFRTQRERAVIALAVSLLVAIAVYLWMLSFGVRQSRLGLLPFFLPTAFENFLKNPTGNMWTWFGPAWLVVLASLVISTTQRTRLILLLSCIALPALATIITADGARVYSLLSLPVLLVLSVWLSSRTGTAGKPPSGAIGLYLIIWIITPTLLNTFTWPGILFGTYAKPTLVDALNSLPVFG